MAVRGRENQNADATLVFLCCSSGAARELNSPVLASSIEDQAGVPNLHMQSNVVVLWSVEHSMTAMLGSKICKERGHHGKAVP